MPSIDRYEYVVLFMNIHEVIIPSSVLRQTAVPSKPVNHFSENDETRKQ